MQQGLTKLTARVDDLARRLAALEDRLEEAARTSQAAKDETLLLQSRLTVFESRLSSLEVWRRKNREPPPLERAFDERLAKLEESGYDPKRFLALAREVKALKESRDERVTSPGGVDLLSSPEFKRLLDEKINRILDYIRSEAIPRAVNEALEWP